MAHQLREGPDQVGLVGVAQPDREPHPVHLDLAVADLDVEAERAVGLGARMADPQPGDTWRVLIDPAGHPFCLTDAAGWG